MLPISLPPSYFASMAKILHLNTGCQQQCHSTQGSSVTWGVVTATPELAKVIPTARGDFFLNPPLLFCTAIIRARGGKGTTLSSPCWGDWVLKEVEKILVGFKNSSLGSDKNTSYIQSTARRRVPGKARTPPSGI